MQFHLDVRSLPPLTIFVEIAGSDLTNSLKLMKLLYKSGSALARNKVYCNCALFMRYVIMYVNRQIHDIRRIIIIIRRL